MNREDTRIPRFRELDRLIAADPEPDVAPRGHKQKRACETIQPWRKRREHYLRATGKYPEISQAGPPRDQKQKSGTKYLDRQNGFT